MPLPLLELLESSAFGLLSAILMTIVETLFWRKWGMEGIAEWQINSVMASKFLRMTNPKLKWTIASHWIHGIAAAIIFPLLLSPIMQAIPIAKTSIVADCVVYTFILWVIFLVLGRRTFESMGQIHITRFGLLSSLLSMMIYGISLGILLSATFL